MNDHAKSAIHIRATEIHEAQAKEETESRRALKMIHHEARNHLDKLFRTVHAIGRKGRPYTDLVWQAELLENCGVNVGNRYRNNKASTEFMKYIAEATREPTKNMLQNAPFLSILSDGSTDVSTKEQEICYVRTCVKGEVTVRMLGLKSVARATAENIKSAIENSVVEYGGLTIDQFYSKLVGFGSDGASVMVGKNA